MLQLTATCEQYESATPYHPFQPLLVELLGVELNGSGAHNRELLSDRLAQVDEELVPWTPLLAAPLNIEVESTPEVDALDRAFWRARLHGVVTQLLGGLLDGPTLLLFEDVHWMDDASAELLRHLGTQLHNYPWLTCTTRRPGSDGFVAAEGNPPLPALSLRLEPLTAEDAKSLAQAAAGERRLSDQELEAIAERGGGNPLFLRELALPDEPTAEAEQLPETVEALVAARIDRLEAGDRALRFGPRCSASPSRLADRRRAPGRRGQPAGRVGAARESSSDPHTQARSAPARLIRDAAYEGHRSRAAATCTGAWPRRRAAAGRRPEEESELLSLHYYRAERWSEAWRYSVVAGRRADEKYANVESQQFFERALEAARKAGNVEQMQVAAVWEALGDVRMRLGDYVGAEAAYRASRKSFPGGPVEQARLIQKEASC
jgi:adenylate cyclase